MAGATVAARHNFFFSQINVSSCWVGGNTNGLFEILELQRLGHPELPWFAFYCCSSVPVFFFFPHICSVIPSLQNFQHLLNSCASHDHIHPLVKCGRKMCYLCFSINMHRWWKCWKLSAVVKIKHLPCSCSYSKKDLLPSLPCIVFEDFLHVFLTLLHSVTAICPHCSRGSRRRKLREKKTTKEKRGVHIDSLIENISESLMTNWLYNLLLLVAYWEGLAVSFHGPDYFSVSCNFTKVFTAPHRNHLCWWMMSCSFFIFYSIFSPEYDF